jgi:hypothetical protein
MRLGNDADRVPVLRQHLEDPPGQPARALDGLVGVGVGAQRQGRGAIFGVAQFGLQQRRRVRLPVQLAFEVEPRRMAEIRMGRPREAIHAAMLAALVGVDRAVERHVGGPIASDDPLRAVDAKRGAQRQRLGVGETPAVVLGNPQLRLEAARRVAHRPAPLARPVGQRIGHVGSVWNKHGTFNLAGGATSYFETIAFRGSHTPPVGGCSAPRPSSA